MRREYWQRQSGERWISGGGGARQAQSSACVNARPARHCMRRSPASRTHPVGIHAASGDNRRRFWDDVTVVRPNGRQPDGIVAADYGVENAAARKSVLSQEVPANMAHWVPAATLECRRRPASRPAGAACLAARHAGRLGAGSAIRCLWPSSIGRSPRSTVSTLQPRVPRTPGQGTGDARARPRSRRIADDRLHCPVCAGNANPNAKETMRRMALLPGDPRTCQRPVRETGGTLWAPGEGGASAPVGASGGRGWRRPRGLSEGTAFGILLLVVRARIPRPSAGIRKRILQKGHMTVRADRRSVPQAGTLRANVF